jgi:hypothetical protein
MDVFHHDNLIVFICICGVDIVCSYPLISVERSLDMTFIQRGFRVYGQREQPTTFFYYCHMLIVSIDVKFFCQQL